MIMSSLSMVEEKLPPGFRFHPRDDELICDYLMKKLTCFDSSSSDLLIEVDLNKCEPWDIPEVACVGGKEWYFYSQRDRKYATGLRTNRATVSGYWKATGKDRPVVRKGSLVGMRKTLVFYQGRAPKGKKTDWVMHEFRLEGPFGPPKLSSSKEDWVLCRVFHKSRDLQPPKHALTQNTSNNSRYDETGSSSLPALMDSYITFDQTPRTTSANDEDDDGNNNNNNNDNNNNSLAYQQVPCFSIFSPEQTNPCNFSHLFQMQPTQPITTTTTTTFSGAGTTMSSSNDGIMNPMSTCERHVINAVLSQLTNKMGSSTASNLKGSSPISLGEAGSSESYLSEVGLPTMWSSHY